MMGENMTTVLPHDVDALANSLNQLKILIEEIKRILTYIQPNSSNLATYGHHTRNVLILAAMEFENECKGVLRTHHYKPKKGIFDTRDFIKLLVPLKLDEYEIILSHYPSLGVIIPFKGWSDENPSKSLGWYRNYNLVKHDRELNFHRGDLHSAIQSVCALAIILAAQHRVIENWRDQIGEFFKFSSVANWRLWENNVHPEADELWQPVYHQF